MTYEVKNRWLVWLKAAGIRALKTWAQTFAASIPATAVLLSDVNWACAFSAACLAALFSLLTSLYGIPEADVPLWDGVNDAR